MSVSIYLPAGGSTFDHSGLDVILNEYETPADLATLLLQNGSSPAVIVTGDLSEDDQGVVAIAIRDHGVRAIEVRYDRWDGFSSSPLSAVCRGVISGFGTNGISAAVGVLSTTDG